MFANSPWALLPPIIAIALALITKEVYSSLFIGIVVGGLLYANFNPVGAMEHVFVDGMIQSGMDAFKAIALGAKGVCIGRPLMAAYTKAKIQGVCEYLQKARGELAKAMAYTGCTDLGKMDSGVIHRIS